MNTSIDIESVRRLVSEREPGSPIELKNRSFENMDLSGWNLRNIDFSGSDFTSVNLDGADLDGASLHNNNEHSKNKVQLLIIQNYETKSTNSSKTTDE